MQVYTYIVTHMSASFDTESAFPSYVRKYFATLVLLFVHTVLCAIRHYIPNYNTPLEVSKLSSNQ